MPVFDTVHVEKCIRNKSVKISDTSGLALRSLAPLQYQLTHTGFAATVRRLLIDG